MNKFKKKSMENKINNKFIKILEKDCFKNFFQISNQQKEESLVSFSKKRFKRGDDFDSLSHLSLLRAREQKKLEEELMDKICSEELKEQNKISKIYNKELYCRVMIHFIKERSVEREHQIPIITSWYSYDNQNKSQIINRQLIKEVDFNFKNQFIWLENARGVLDISIWLHDEKNLVVELGNHDVNQFNCDWIIQRIKDFVKENQKS